MGLALFSHVVLIVLALGSTSRRPEAMRAVHRDTILLDLARVEPDPPDGSEPTRSRSDDFDVAPPPIPEIPIETMKASQLSFTYERPADSSMVSLRRHIRKAAAAADSSPLVSNTIDVDELPELMEELRPSYPEGLRLSGVSGLVQVEYVVGADGRMDLGSLRVLGSPHPGFVLAAVAALRVVRFRPARRAGQPIPVLVRQAIRFALQ